MRTASPPPPTSGDGSHAWPRTRGCPSSLTALSRLTNPTASHQETAGRWTRATHHRWGNQGPERTMALPESHWERVAGKEPILSPGCHGRGGLRPPPDTDGQLRFSACGVILDQRGSSRGPPVVPQPWASQQKTSAHPCNDSRVCICPPPVPDPLPPPVLG